MVVLGTGKAHNDFTHTALNIQISRYGARDLSRTHAHIQVHLSADRQLFNTQMPRADFKIRCPGFDTVGKKLSRTYKNTDFLSLKAVRRNQPGAQLRLHLPCF